MEDQSNQEGKSIDERQIVVFKIGHEEFGVNIMEVREIIRMEEITKLPDVEEYIEGVINIRGGIIVVIDLAMKIGLPSSETDKNTRIIVVEIDDSKVGMVVDSATEVLRLTGSNVKPAPSIITKKIDASYIEGVGIVGERLLILLDLAKVLSGSDFKKISGVSKEISVEDIEEAKQEIESSEGDAKKINEVSSTDNKKTDLEKPSSPKVAKTKVVKKTVVKKKVTKKTPAKKVSVKKKTVTKKSIPKKIVSKKTSKVKK